MCLLSVFLAEDCLGAGSLVTGDDALEAKHWIDARAQGAKSGVVARRGPSAKVNAGGWDRAFPTVPSWAERLWNTCCVCLADKCLGDVIALAVLFISNVQGPCRNLDGHTLR